MIHEMNLNNQPFEMIKSGEKTIELRLNDLKRSQIKMDDYIIFTNILDQRKLIVKVMNLYHFTSFDELYLRLSLNRIGYSDHELAHAKADDMLLYYTKEQQLQYGVLGIEVKFISNDDAISIVDMREEHYAQKGYVHYQSWIETYTGIMNQAFLDKRTLERCVSIAKDYPENTLVALFDHQVVGFAAYNKSSDQLEDTGEIYAIYVLKEFQKLGIGKMLMQACLNRLNNYKNNVLYVLDQNHRAITWYQQQGFVFDGHEKKVKTSVDGYYLVEQRMVYVKINA